MGWAVELADGFEAEFDSLPEEVQDEILALARLLQRFGPELGRPRADTLKGSKHANMKELRFHAASGAWRSRSMGGAERCCWRPGTSRAAVRGGFTAG